MKFCCRCGATNLAQFCDIFCDEHGFTVAESRRVLTAGKDSGMGLRMHMEQFAADGGAALAGELGAATADHLEFTGEHGIAALARAGVQLRYEKNYRCSG